MFENWRCLKKNQGIQILLGVQKVLSEDKDEHIPMHYSPNMTSSMKLSPITSIDVEVSSNL